MYYIADKAEKSIELAGILNKVNDICLLSIKKQWSDNEKKQALFDLIKANQIKIKIPCLLVYTADIYYDESTLTSKIEEDVNQAISDFEKSNYLVAKELDHEILFCVFPIKDIKKLRSNIIKFKKGGN